MLSYAESKTAASKLVTRVVDPRANVKVHPCACCPEARVTFCVCRISFTCPTHGQTCVGSHD